MSKKQDAILRNLTNPQGAFRAKEEFYDMLEILTAANTPPPLSKPRITDSLDRLYSKVWGNHCIAAINYMAMVHKRDTEHEIYPFIQELLLINPTKLRAGEFSLDDLIDLANDKIESQGKTTYVDFTEVRRLINYYMDKLGSTEARSIMFGFAPEMTETSMRIAIDPSHPDSFKERDANMKFIGLRLPDKNNVSINIDKSTTQVNQQTNMGLPSFRESVSVGTNLNPPVNQKSLPESTATGVDFDIIDLDSEIDESKVAERIFLNREIHKDTSDYSDMYDVSDESDELDDER